MAKATSDQGRGHVKKTHYTIDLHTHSIASPDGGLTAADYERMVKYGPVNYVAITDHNTTDFARQLQEKWGGPEDPVGRRIIIGEEIRTAEGEIIGLYLQETIPKLLSPYETVQRIVAQGGLVCIPHPFEDVRRGMSRQALDDLAASDVGKHITMIEVHNGRAVFQNKSKQAYAAAGKYGWPGVASSDAHARAGWGKTYTTIPGIPRRETLAAQLADAQYTVGFPGIRAVLYPKFNRLKKWYAPHA